MIIEDMIILGKGCPDRIRNGRMTVCVAGFSPKLRFLRIYPTRTDASFSRWDIINVEAEKNPQDNRNESWKIVGSKNEWDSLNKKIKVLSRLKNQKDKKRIIEENIDDCVNIIKDSRRSLGIIKPTIVGHYFSQREDYNPYYQPTLKEWFSGRITPFKTKENYPTIPKIQYHCSKCTSKSGHDQQIVDWGCYEWMRKYPDKKEQLWENLKLNSQKSDIYFLVGNLAYHRTSFVIISVLSIQKENHVS